MIKKQLLWLSLVLSLAVNAQLREAFNALDLPSDACFLPLSSIETSIADGKKLKTAKQNQDLDAWVFALEQAQLPHCEVSGLTNVRLEMNERKSTDGVERLGLVMKHYYHWRDNKALPRDEEGIYLPEGSFSDYAEKRFAFFAFSNQSELPKHGIDVLLESDFLFGAAPVTDMSIDFDDGLGFRPLSTGSLINVQYASAQEFAEIVVQGKLDGALVQFKFYWGDTSLAAKMNYPEPDPSPWPSTNPNLPWFQQVNYDGTTIAANIYPWISEDGIFDQPFIFIEGIDFLPGISDLRCGEFGWETFISGGATNSNYQFLENAPLLLSELRNLGKDIILIDFADGAGNILANAELVKHAIRLCNEYKEGSEANVLVGTSMGGVLGRIALRQIEGIDSEDHCTSLFISHDSPQSGANIPLSLQAMIAQLSIFRPEAQTFLDGYLLRPAAKAMLVLQQDPELEHVSEGFYQYLDELGYPEECRNVAVVNGSTRGEHNGIVSGAPLIDFDCHHQLVGSVFRLYGVAVPGDGDHDAANGNNRVICDVVYAKRRNFFLVDIWDLPPYIRNLSGQPYWDALPGGTRTSFLEFVDVVNLSIDTEPDFPDACTLIEPWHYTQIHSFIPSFSALGMDRQFAASFIDDEIENDPTICPFDAYFSPEEGNEQHSYISTNAIEFIMEELESVGAILPQEFTANSLNNGVFNYAKPSHDLIHSCHIHSGGNVLVNAFVPTHFAQSEDYIPNGTPFELRTASCSADLLIDQGGALEIGDAGENYPARLVLRRGSTLRIGEGGTIRIHATSQLIVERGAELILEAGGRLIVDDGCDVIVESGGQFTAQGSGLELLGAHARVRIEGELVIPADEKLHLKPVDGQMGYLSIANSGVRVWGSASELEIEGLQSEQKALELEGNIAFSEDFHRLKLKNALIEFSANDLYLPCRFTALNCTFQNTAEQGLAAVKILNQNNLKNCIFETVRIEAMLSNSAGHKLLLNECDFYGNACGVQVHGQGYRAKSCLFAEQTELASYDLTLPSIADECIFEGGAYGVYDDSHAHLQVASCSFVNYGLAAIFKRRGLLSVKCSEITNSQTGIRLSHGALNMSNLAQAGNNYLECLYSTIHATNCDALLLKDGFNRFVSWGSFNIEATLNADCGEDCGSEFELDLSNNMWVPEGGDPTTPSVLITLFSDCPGGATCELELISEPYAANLDCGISSNPRIPNGIAGGLNAHNGSNSELDDYEVHLSKAIAKMKAFNHEGDDELAFLAFEELLGQSFKWNEFDLNKKMWYKLALAFSQAAFENLVNDHGDIAQVHPLEANYLSMLAAFDDPAQNKTTVAERFNMELYKAGFMQARMQRPHFRNIMQKAASCGMDESGLELINHALLRNEAYDMQEQFGLMFFLSSMESELEAIEAALWNETAVKNSWLIDRQQVDFESCSGDNKSGSIEYKAALLLYPNPGSGEFTIDLREISKPRQLQIVNALGLLVFEMPIAPEQQFLDLRLALSPGIYFVSVLGDEGQVSQKYLFE